MQDTKLLNVDWAALSHTSDYFEKMQELCERLIKEGKKFLRSEDDTSHTHSNQTKLPEGGGGSRPRRNLRRLSTG